MSDLYKIISFSKRDAWWSSMKNRSLIGAIGTISELGKSVVSKGYSRCKMDISTLPKNNEWEGVVNNGRYIYFCAVKLEKIEKKGKNINRKKVMK